MSNHKHTPGQWIINTDLNSDPILTDDGISILDFESVGVVEYPANLRLIASAPELLEACEVALQLLSEQPSFAEMFGDGDMVKRTLLSAIAKATGDENE